MNSTPHSIQIQNWGLTTKCSLVSYPGHFSEWILCINLKTEDSFIHMIDFWISLFFIIFIFFFLVQWLHLNSMLSKQHELKIFFLCMNVLHNFTASIPCWVFLFIASLRLIRITWQCHKPSKARHTGHCWKNKDKFISNIYLWTPTHGQTSIGWPAKTYPSALCGHWYCLEDWPRAIANRDR